MATRPRKYTGAAPEEVKEAVEEQERADGHQSDEAGVQERGTWRYSQIVRAGKAMMASGDPAWLEVAAWLRQATISANAARMARVEPVLPGGQFDYAGRIASAYLRSHGG